MSTKEIAKVVREELKRQLPEWTFSVRIKNYSGGSSITLALMSGPEQVVEAHHEWEFGGTHTKKMYGKDNPFQGYAQLNHYQLLGEFAEAKRERLSNGEYLTPKGWEVMRKATQILSADHWDKSDSMIDYHNCNFYRHVQIGEWNRPYTVKP